MNSCTIIGNLTRDPEISTVNTINGAVTVCRFGVAVNGRQRDANGNNKAEFFNVTAWRQLGENSYKFLAKGRKVCVMGPVVAHAYNRNDGSTAVTLEITAEKVEFLSSRNDVSDQTGTPAQNGLTPNAAPVPQMNDYNNATPVEIDELPF